MFSKLWALISGQENDKNDGKAFTQDVLEAFDFLVRDYGFTAEVLPRPRDRYNDGDVEFRSASTILVIFLDRFSLYILIGPIEESEYSRVSLGNAINYLSNGNDQSLKNRRDGPKPFREFTGYVLEQCAKALSQYSDPLLLPNYDGWLDMLKFSLKRGGLQWYEVANNNSMIHKYIRQQENKQTKQQGKS